MNKEVKHLLKAHNQAFKSGDCTAFSEKKLGKKGIKKGQRLRKHLEDHFKSMDTRGLWKKY